MKKCLVLILVLLMSFGSTAFATLDTDNTTLEEYGLYIETINGVPQYKEVGPNRLTDEEGVTITVFTDMNENSKTPDQVLMSKWYEDKTNVHVDWVCPPHSEISTQLTLNLSSGDYCDLYFAITLSPAAIMSYVNQDVIAPITPYLEEYGPNYYNLIQNDSDVRAAAIAPDGEVYNWTRSGGAYHSITPGKWYIYTPWLEVLNMEMPETIDEFYNYLVAIRDQDVNQNGDPNDEIPFMTSGWSAVRYLLTPFETVNGSNVNVKDGQVYAPFMSEAYKEGLTWVKKLYDEGLIAKDCFVTDTSQLLELCSRPEEMIVGTTISPWSYNLWFAKAASWTELGRDVYQEWTAIGPLAGPDGIKRTGGSSDAGINSFISGTCSNPEICVGWVDYFYTKEGAQVSYLGFEGYGYEVVDEPSISGKTPSYRKINNSAYTSGQNINWGANGPRMATFEDRYMQTRASNLETAIYDESQSYLDSFDDEYIKTLWFDSEQADIISNLESPIMAWVEEASVAFITGSMSIEKDWDSYIAQLNALGAEEWITTYQAAYDSTK